LSGKRELKEQLLEPEVKKAPNPYSHPLPQAYVFKSLKIQVNSGGKKYDYLYVKANLSLKTLHSHGC